MLTGLTILVDMEGAHDRYATDIINEFLQQICDGDDRISFDAGEDWKDRVTVVEEE
jgi:hypothetical protein